MNKREQFYNQALQLIHRYGFRGTSMRMIADKMNCDVSNLYNYIDSKDAFLEKILFALSKEFHTRIDQIIKSNYGDSDKLQQIIRMYVQMSFEKPLEMSLLVNEWRHLGATKQAQFLAERKDFEVKVKKLVRQGIRQGVFRKMDPEVATHLVLSACRWLFNYFTDTGRSMNPLELERQIYAFVADGMLA